MNIIFSIFFFRINLIKKNILDPLTYIVKKELFRILLDMLGRVSLLQGKIFGDFLPGDKTFLSQLHIYYLIFVKNSLINL